MRMSRHAQSKERLSFYMYPHSTNFESHFCSNLEDGRQAQAIDLIFYDAEMTVCIFLIVYVLNFHTITVM